MEPIDNNFSANASASENTAHENPGVAQSKNRHRQPLSPVALGGIILVLAIIVAVIWYSGGFKSNLADDYNKTSFENLSGVQGMVGYVDYQNNKFVTERVVLTQESGEFIKERSVFNFNWNENTNFFYYRNGLALETSQPWQVDYTYLTDTRNVIVKTQEQAEPNKELTAIEVHILPGSSRAEAATQ